MYSYEKEQARLWKLWQEVSSDYATENSCFNSSEESLDKTCVEHKFGKNQPRCLIEIN